MPVSGDTSPFSSSTTSNWVARAGGLPGRVRAIARAIRRRNPDWPLSRCIATAINAIKYSAATGDAKLPGRQNEGADVVSAHAAAVAEWMAKRAKTAASKGKSGGASKSSKVAASHPLALGNGPACTCGGPHDCVFWSQRSAPQVLHPGRNAAPKTGYGSFVKRRRATDTEEADIKAGRWIRVDSAGRKPSDPNYTQSRLRPQLAAAATGTKTPPFTDPKSGSTTVSKTDADDPRVKAMAQKLIDGGYDEERAWKVATAVIRRGKGAKGGNTASSTATAQRSRGGLALASAFNPTQHPRAAAGAAGGGRFVAVGQAKDQAGAKAQQDQKAAANYKTAITAKDPKAAVKGLNDQDLAALTAYAYSAHQSDPEVVALRGAVAAEMGKRGYDIRKYGALGGGNGSGKMVAAAPKAKTAKKSTKKTSSTKKSTKTAHEASGGLALATPLSDSQSGSAVTVRDSSKATGSGPTNTKLDAASRRQMAKDGVALKDGSFPVRNQTDLRNAIAAHGRAKASKQPMVKAHIKKRAKAIGAEHKLPADWK